MIDRANALELLNQMLHDSVPEAAILRTQLEDLELQPIDRDGSWSLSPSKGAKLQDLRGVIVEAEAHDLDGADISALLHCRDGWLDELEIYRPDGQAVRGATTADQFIISYPAPLAEGSP